MHYPTLVLETLQNSDVLLYKGVEGEGMEARRIKGGMSDSLCGVILTSGTRKSLTCHKKAVEQNEFEKPLCRIHYRLEQRRPYNPFTESECEAHIDSEQKNIIGNFAGFPVAFPIAELNEKLRANLHQYVD